MLNFYSHYKFHHFYSFCFGLGCGLVSFRPHHSFVMPSVFTVFFTVAFEVAGISLGLPPHTKKCRGAPYESTDVCCGLSVALLAALYHLGTSHMWTISYGCGLIVFAVCGEIRKRNSLWKKHERFYYR